MLLLLLLFFTKNFGMGDGKSGYTSHLEHGGGVNGWGVFFTFFFITTLQSDPDDYSCHRRL